MTRSLLRCIAVVAGVLSACGGKEAAVSASTPDDTRPTGGTNGSGPVGASGGTVSLPGGATVSIPPGALAGVAVITVAASEAPPPPGALTPLYRLGPSGTTFATPITVSFPVPPGTTPANAAVYLTKMGSETEFEPLETTVVGSTASAQITHFSGTFVGIPCENGAPCVAGTCYDGSLTCAQGHPVCISHFAGVYSGTWTAQQDPASSMWSAVVGDDGAVTGYAAHWLGYSFALAGAITCDGRMQLGLAGDISSHGSFAGTSWVDGAVAGTWTDRDFGSGTFSGHWIAAGTFKQCGASAGPAEVCPVGFHATQADCTTTCGLSWCPNHYTCEPDMVADRFTSIGSNGFFGPWWAECPVGFHVASGAVGAPYTCESNAIGTFTTAGARDATNRWISCPIGFHVLPESCAQNAGPWACARIPRPPATYVTCGTFTPYSDAWTICSPGYVEQVEQVPIPGRHTCVWP